MANFEFATPKNANEVAVTQRDLLKMGAATQILRTMDAGYRNRISGNEQRLEACSALILMLNNTMEHDPDKLPTGGKFRSEIDSLAPDIDAQGRALRRWADSACREQEAAIAEHNEAEKAYLAWEARHQVRTNRLTVTQIRDLSRNAPDYMSLKERIAFGAYLRGTEDHVAGWALNDNPFSPREWFRPNPCYAAWERGWGHANEQEHGTAGTGP